MAPVRSEDFDYLFQPAGLKSLREQLSLTQADMATLLDVPVNTVSRWERGANAPDANVLAAIYSIARERDVTPEFFARRANPMTARRGRTTLVFHWDFQNLAEEDQYVSEEWDYMKRYMGLLFPRADETVQIAHTSIFHSSGTGLNASGFRVVQSMQDVDTEIIREGRRLFGLSGTNGQIQLDASGQSHLSHGEWFDPEDSAYTLITNDGDYSGYLKELQQSGVETFVWGTDECNDGLRNSIGLDHFIPWDRPYITVKCMEVVKELGGRPVTKAEFGNMCKSVLDETGFEIFPEDANFSHKRPYASVLKYLEVNGLVRVRELGRGSDTISITVSGVS